MANYLTKEDVLKQAKIILNKTLREIIPAEKIAEVESKIFNYQNRRKGLLGELIEWFIFDKKADGRSEADFNIAGVELKTTPLKKHISKQYVSKERLVFSMIDYDKIIVEKWKTSSFLKKNKLLLLMFYLWTQNQSIVDYKFKFIHLLSLFEDISKEDIFQIQKDWEFIVNKIRCGEAHLLSEGDTYYLGACTKAANSSVVRDQPMSRTPAKPRAFSLKQQYLNFLIQKQLLGNKVDTKSIFKNRRGIETIEVVIRGIFNPFIGKTDKQIISSLGTPINGSAKGYKRLLVNKIIGIDTGKIEELEKSNTTLKVITLEHTGTLRESVSFPAFDYKDLVSQVWYDDKGETMSDFHTQLETKKFLFVVFQKLKDSEDIILKRAVIWNFPLNDIKEAERVWQKTVDSINEDKYAELPKIKDSKVVHVRPHGRDSADTLETPQGTQEVRRSFWLNAKYIQHALEKDQD